MKTRKISKLKEGLLLLPVFGFLKYKTFHTEVERGVLRRKNFGANF
jgi:hypothetical protein